MVGATVAMAPSSTTGMGPWSRSDLRKSFERGRGPAPTGRSGTVQKRDGRRDAERMASDGAQRASTFGRPQGGQRPPRVTMALAGHPPRTKGLSAGRPATSVGTGAGEPVQEWDAEASGTPRCAVSANLRLHAMRPLGT